MPSSPSRHACSNIVGPSSSRCSLNRIAEPAGRRLSNRWSKALRSANVVCVKSQPVAMKQVEHVVVEPVLTAGFQMSHQIVETGYAVCILDHDLPVEQRRADSQVLKRL